MVGIQCEVTEEEGGKTEAEGRTKFAEEKIEKGEETDVVEPTAATDMRVETTGAAETAGTKLIAYRGGNSARTKTGAFGTGL